MTDDLRKKCEEQAESLLEKHFWHKSFTDEKLIKWLSEALYAKEKRINTLEKKLEMAEFNHTPICSADAGKGWEKKFDCWVCELEAKEKEIYKLNGLLAARDLDYELHPTAQDHDMEIMQYKNKLKAKEKRIATLEAELKKSKDPYGRLWDENNKLKSRIKELEGLLSQDTAEFKSAAFQRIKELEAKAISVKVPSVWCTRCEELEKENERLKNELESIGMGD